MHFSEENELGHELYNDMLMDRTIRSVVASAANCENKVLCARCAGACCKTAPGICMPEDFKAPLKKSLKRALKSGKYIANSYMGWDPDDEQYYIQPATKSGGYGEGECIFLTPSGCRLQLKNRPFTCRTMVPKQNMECEGFQLKRRHAALMWADYNDAIGAIVASLKKKPHNKRVPRR